MPKATVTYHALKGDSKISEGWGYTFFDGKPEEVEVSDDVLQTIKGNKCFSVSEKGEHKTK